MNQGVRLGYLGLMRLLRQLNDDLFRLAPGRQTNDERLAELEAKADVEGAYVDAAFADVKAEIGFVNEWLATARIQAAKEAIVSLPLTVRSDCRPFMTSLYEQLTQAEVARRKQEWTTVRDLCAKITIICQQAPCSYELCRTNLGGIVKAVGETDQWGTGSVLPAFQDKYDKIKTTLAGGDWEAVNRGCREWRHLASQARARIAMVNETIGPAKAAVAQFKGHERYEELRQELHDLRALLEASSPEEGQAAVARFCRRCAGIRGHIGEADLISAPKEAAPKMTAAERARAEQAAIMARLRNQAVAARV